jgi:hypothetical protein
MGLLHITALIVGVTVPVIIAITAATILLG